MDNTKKTILMCLIPVALTIFFIVQFTVPAISKYFNLNKQIEQEKVAIKNIKSKLNLLRANKSMAQELERLNTELIGFDVEFPSDFRDEILLIDFEIFANEAVNRIVGIKTSVEQEVEIIDPNAVPDNKKMASRRKKEEPVKPVRIIEKTFDVNTVAYYNELIDFVKFLENYQRKINIKSITAEIFDDDSENPNPRIDLQIQASAYKSVINNKEEENDEKSKG